MQLAKRMMGANSTGEDGGNNLIKQIESIGLKEQEVARCTVLEFGARTPPWWTSATVAQASASRASCHRDT